MRTLKKQDVNLRGDSTGSRGGQEEIPLETQ